MLDRLDGYVSAAVLEGALAGDGLAVGETVSVKRVALSAGAVLLAGSVSDADVGHAKVRVDGGQLIQVISYHPLRGWRLIVGPVDVSLCECSQCLARGGRYDAARLGKFGTRICGFRRRQGSCLP